MSNVIPFGIALVKKQLDALSEEALFQMRSLLLSNENIDLKGPEWGAWIDRNRVAEKPGVGLDLTEGTKNEKNNIIKFPA